jgi:hypothetical protein
MSTNSQEPVRRADGMIELTREQSDQLLRVPIDLARAEAETMIAKGVSPDIAFRHLEAGYQKSYEARARIAAGANAQQQPAPPAPAAAEQPAPTPVRPPIEEPRTLGERFMANAREQREQRLEQERTVDSRMHMSMPMGLKRR